MLKLLANPKRAARRRTVAALKHTVLHTEREPGGWPVGVVVNTALHQASVLLSINDASTGVCDDTVAAAIGKITGVEAVVSVWCGALTRQLVGVTFHADTKKERKERAELTGEAATRIRHVIDCAAERGVVLVPLSDEEITAWASRWFDDTQQTVTFPPVTSGGEITPRSFSTPSRTTIAFCLDDDAAVAEEITAAVRQADTFDVWLTHILRPSADSPEVRFVNLLVVGGSDVVAAEALGVELLGELSAYTALRVRRVFDRQAVMRLAATGVGLMPWDAVEDRLVEAGK